MVAIQVLGHAGKIYNQINISNLMQLTAPEISYLQKSFRDILEKGTDACKDLFDKEEL